jgi:hypothetical protein
MLDGKAGKWLQEISRKVFTRFKWPFGFAQGTSWLSEAEAAGN